MISRKLQMVIASLVVAILAMGFYLVYLKRRAESMGRSAPTQALSAPINGPEGQMTLYLASDEENRIYPVSMDSALPEDAGERARVALHSLLARFEAEGSPHPIGRGADVAQVFLLDSASAVVNLNAEMASAQPGGIEVEQLTLFSMVMTLKAQLPQLKRVRFLVDGKTRETLAGHIGLAGWTDVALVAESAGYGSQAGEPR